jgi:hypothetical protein
MKSLVERITDSYNLFCGEGSKMHIEMSAETQMDFHKEMRELIVAYGLISSEGVVKVSKNEKEELFPNEFITPKFHIQIHENPGVERGEYLTVVDN